MDISAFERLFGLDAQLIFDALIEFSLLMILYFSMTRLFFKPVRKFMEERQAKVDADQKAADDEQAQILELKKIYEDKLEEAHKEAGAFVSKSRKLALKEQEDIIAQAKLQASAIIDKANEEARQAKESIRDEVKTEMGAMAETMAGQFVDVPDKFRQALLLEETLKEMGDTTWQH